MNHIEPHSLVISHIPTEYVGARVMKPGMPQDVDLRHLAEVITDTDTAYSELEPLLANADLRTLAVALRGALENNRVLAHHLLLLHRGAQQGQWNYTEPVQDVYDDLRN